MPPQLEKNHVVPTAWQDEVMGNSWGNSETVSDFIFLGSKITTDGDCSHEIKSPSFTLSEHMFSSILKCSLPTFFNSQLFFFPWKTALGAEHEGKNGTHSVPLGR